MSIKKWGFNILLLSVLLFTTACPVGIRLNADRLPPMVRARPSIAKSNSSISLPVNASILNLENNLKAIQVRQKINYVFRDSFQGFGYRERAIKKYRIVKMMSLEKKSRLSASNTKTIFITRLEEVK